MKVQSCLSQPFNLVCRAIQGIILSILKNSKGDEMQEKRKDYALESIEGWESLDPEIQSFFKNKRLVPEEWLQGKATKQAKRRRMASHPCKFSHPDVSATKATPVIAKAERVADGYCRSGNIETQLKLDSYGDAAALPVQTFLDLKMEDGQTLLEHIEQETELSKSQLSILCKTGKYESLRDRFLVVKQEDGPQRTSSKVKQVYFPVGNSYHQLSILTPSMLIFEMKRRIGKMRFDDLTKEAQKLRKKNEYSETGYEEIFDLSVIGYGGSNKQNISTLNNQFGGRSYLLSSLPPSLQGRKVRLPRKDFFRDCLWSKDFEDRFTSLHKLLVVDVNNLAIRQGRDEIVLFVFDRIVARVWQIRNEEAGWTKRERFQGLPTYQKWVLDNSYARKREEEAKYSEHITKFLEESARWIVVEYEKILGKKAKTLSDHEIGHFYKVLCDKREALS